MATAHLSDCGLLLSPVHEPSASCWEARYFSAPLMTASVFLSTWTVSSGDGAFSSARAVAPERRDSAAAIRAEAAVAWSERFFRYWSIIGEYSCGRGSACVSEIAARSRLITVINLPLPV